MIATSTNSETIQQAEVRARVKKILLEGEQHRYDPRYVEHFGGDAAIFVSQLLFRDGHGMDPDGWIYKSEREWSDETGLSRRRQRKARKILLARGVVEERRGKEPGSGRPINYYRLDGMRLLQIVDPNRADVEGFGEAEKGDTRDGRKDGITDLSKEDGITAPIKEDGITAPFSEDGVGVLDIQKNTQQSTSEAHTIRDSTSVAGDDENDDDTRSEVEAVVVASATNFFTCEDDGDDRLDNDAVDDEIIRSVAAGFAELLARYVDQDHGEALDDAQRAAYERDFAAYVLDGGVATGSEQSRIAEHISRLWGLCDEWVSVDEALDDLELER